MLGGNPERIIHDIDSDISFSPDRTHFVFMRKKRNEGEGDLIIANADGSGEKLLSKQTTRVYAAGLVSRRENRLWRRNLSPNKSGFPRWIFLILRRAENRHSRSPTCF